MREKTSLTKKWFLTAVSVIFILTVMGVRVEAQEEKTEKKIEETPEIVEKGKKIYEKKCINCHGEKGDAKVPATPLLYPEPRDFTKGLFKIKNTHRGELPTEEDIFQVITKGMPGTSMPGWAELPLEERWGLVYYIKSFSERFTKAKEDGKYPPPTIKVGKPIPSSPESIKKGEEIFFELECDMCHGEDGRGDGFKALKMKTKWGTKILPRDLSRNWNFSRGHTPEDIYRTIRIGVEGTPMPSFANILDNPSAEDEDDEEEEEEDEEGGAKEPPKAPATQMSGEERTWHLVNYTLSLSPTEKPKTMAAYQVKRMEGELPESPDDEKWNDVPMSEYPMAGQIIVKPRMFTSRIDFVQLKALYNDEEIAFLLTWHDPSKMTKTDPDKGRFTDAVVLQLPQNSEGQKPYFLNGDSENPAYLLHWSADSEGSITEINASGMNRMVAQEQGNQNAKGAVIYDKGEYRLLIKRPLTTDDKKDTQLVPGKFIPIAFSAWEGSNKETGTKRSISSWYFLILEARLPKEIYYYPFLAIFAVAVVEFIIIGWVRKNKPR